MTHTSGLEGGREVICGYFGDTSKAERAVGALRQAGFAQIGVATRDRKKAEKIADKSDARTGMAVGSGAGGTLEQMFGETAYSDLHDIHGSLLAARIPGPQASYFERRVQKGGVLLTVQAPLGRADEAQRVLESEGADTGAEAAGIENPAQEQTLETAPTAEPVAEPRPTASSSTARDLSMEAPLESGTGEHVIQLHGELLRIHKERVQRGEVRLRKEVVTEAQRVEVPVEREELVVERTPVEGRASSEPIGGGGEVRIPLSEEKVSVEKQPVVTEEVRVGKREVQGTEPVNEEVRREELRTEEKGLSPEELRELREKQRRAA